MSRVVVPWLGAEGYGMVYPYMAVDLPATGLGHDRLAEAAEAAGLDDAEMLTLSGDPALSICNAAESHDVDVVVIGSHDKGVLHRLLDPSVAQAVVQGTYRPVLVVSGTPPTDTES